MKFCDDHWKHLTQAIEDRGLSHFMSTDLAKGTDTRENFDPLMNANFMIWGNCIEAFGMRIVETDAPCPLCVLDKHAKECTDTDCKMRQSGLDWINLAADEQVERATELGLLGRPN